MRERPTEIQAETLAFIKTFIKENQFPPTFREIAEHFGIAPPTVSQHLDALERKGYITRRNREPRTIVVVRP